MRRLVDMTCTVYHVKYNNYAFILSVTLGRKRALRLDAIMYVRLVMYLINIKPNFLPSVSVQCYSISAVYGLKSHSCLLTSNVVVYSDRQLQINKNERKQ